MADLSEPIIGLEPPARGSNGTVELTTADENNGEVPDVPPSEIPVLPLREIHGFKPGSKTNPFLPQVPVVVTVTARTGHATTATDSPSRRPRLVVTLEHGEFKWTIHKNYREVLSLRRELIPLRDKLRRRRSRRDILPSLLNLEDMNVRQGTRLRKQVPKVQTFLNAVVSSRTYRSHPATARFFEVSRISFIKDTGLKKKEGLLTKRSGGHRRAVDCFGFTACFICRCSFWRKRWFALKDSYLIMIRSHHSAEARRTISGVLLFDTGMSLNYGLAHTGITNGIKISTQSRDLLVRAPSKRVMNEWVSSIESVMESTAKIWVDPKPCFSFAPEHSNTPSKWYVDGQQYMSDVADAILAAKDEIFIADWQISPHIFLKREGSHKNRLQWRLDYLLLKKAKEGVRVFLQVYKELELAIQLGSEHAQKLLKHPNVVFFRHPNVFIAGVVLWGHHEKLVIIDQSLAFVGGIDLAFGRWDNECHEINDHYSLPSPHTIPEQTPTELLLDGEAEEESDVQQWIGKDFYNPFIKDFVELEKPFNDSYDRSKDPRMPWHDIASAVYGPAARDVARHFIQRYNFTKREQDEEEEVPYLLPRKTFSQSEEQETGYLRDILTSTGGTHIYTSAQVLRSVDEWSAGVPLEHSIMNAWIQAIDKAEHFIYIEQQFFISSLLKEKITNGVAEALRLRIARAYRQKKTFRVIIVMPLLPSFPAEKFGEKETAVLEAVLHWNYYTLSRGEDSLFGRLQREDGIPEDEIKNYISVYGLRTHGEINGTPKSEIVYVHSKLMVVDDRITIIGSANVNDRSMTGERDSEVAIRFEDKEMIDGAMNSQPYQVGKFSHSIRVHIFKEHLGLLPSQCKGVTVEGSSPDDISVEDPASDEFYLNTWMKAASKNTLLYKQVFGGFMVPTDDTVNYKELKQYRTNSGVVKEDVARARETLVKIQGHLVELPLHFLEKQDLTPDFNYIVSLAPDTLFQ